MDTLSAILLESRLVDRESLADALAQARNRGIPLQVYLVESGLLVEDDLLAILKQSVLVGNASDEELRTPQPQAISIVPQALAEVFHLVPLRVDDEGNLVVAMSNPTDIHAIDELSHRTGMYVTRLLAPVSAVESALDRWYRNPKAGKPTASAGTVDAQDSQQSTVVLLTKVKRKPPAVDETLRAAPVDVVPLTRIKRRVAKAAPSAQSGKAVAASSKAAQPHKKPATQPGLPVSRPPTEPGKDSYTEPAEAHSQKTAKRPPTRRADATPAPVGSKKQTVRLLPSSGLPTDSVGHQTPSVDKKGGGWSLPESADEVKAAPKKQGTLVGLPTKPGGRQNKRIGGSAGAGKWGVPGSPGALKTVAFDALRKQLVTCHDPNDVGRALVAYLHHWVERVLFFVVKDGALQGRFAMGFSSDTDPRQVILSLSTPSTVGNVVAARVPYQGALPPHGQDGVLARILGTDGQVLLAPILVRTKVVALLCGAFATNPIPDRELGDVVVLAERQYERILAERKRSGSQS